MMVVSSSEIKEEEVRLTVGASRAGKSSSPAGGAEEVRKTAKKVEEVVWNAVFALLARRFSLSGLTTPSASVIEVPTSCEDDDCAPVHRSADDLAHGCFLQRHPVWYAVTELCWARRRGALPPAFDQFLKIFFTET